MRSISINKTVIKALITAEIALALAFLITDRALFVIILSVYYILRLVLSFSKNIMDRISDTLTFNMESGTPRVNPTIFKLRLMTGSLIAASFCAVYGAGTVCTVIMGHLIIVEFLYLTCDFSLYESFYDHLESRL